MLGIGAAWYDREHAGLGVPFPPTSERFERLEEALQVCRRMWSDDDSPYEGKHYQLAEPVSVPQPIRQGGPRILIGGSGEQKTLRLVAKYADACNLFGDDPDEIAHKLEVLDRHCDERGPRPRRDPAHRHRRATPSTTSTGSYAGWRRSPPSASTRSGPARAPTTRSAASTEICERVLPRLAEIG